MIEPWEQIATTPLRDFKVFSVREDCCRSPRTQQAHPFYVIEAADWVNVIPVTPDGQVVCVRQYRHGTRAVTLEIPGGIIDPADATPEAAARRELREETGYDTDDLVYLGAVAPNPAIQNNRCHMILARDARPVAAQRLDGTEDIEVVRVDAADLPRLVAEGQITHALVVAALFLWQGYADGS